MAKNKLLGNAGEGIACDHLQKNGYRILERNYRCKLGEIDIIGLDGDTVAFIEVKTRSSDRYGSPSEAVNRGKQGRIVKTALSYMQSKAFFDRMCRFDVIEIIVDGPDALYDIHLIKDAFQYSGRYGY